MKERKMKWQEPAKAEKYKKVERKITIYKGGKG